MTPLLAFAKSITDAQRQFVPGDCSSWLAFYEAKQTAYGELLRAQPEVRAIEDEGFWRCMQNMPLAEWLPTIDAKVERIIRRRSLCHDCGAIKISWPKHLCPECKKARRLETYRKAKERARIKQRTRKCPRCKIEPLDYRQKICRRCRANARRQRNRRYQKSLKERKARRVQPEFTSEGTSTIPISQPVTLSVQSVAPEAVLAGGVT
jgi:hypothetical protein